MDAMLHVEENGAKDGAPLVFANALGCDLHMWDGVVAALPTGLRILRYDMRGHGQSTCPKGPYTMGGLVRDVEIMLEQRAVRDAVFVGLSIGGMVAQGLAVKRLDLVRGLVLSNTAAKIGTAQMWRDRAALVRAEGVQALAGATIERWFSKRFRDAGQDAPWRAMLEAQNAEGYAACAEAIAGTDFYTPTSGLRLPCLGIAGSEDGSTPPDLVRETVDLIPGSRFHLMRRVGHQPGIEQPDAYAALLTDFLREIGHI